MPIKVKDWQEDKDCQAGALDHLSQKMKDAEHHLENLGKQNDWALHKNYNRYRKTEQRSAKPHVVLESLKQVSPQLKEYALKKQHDRISPPRVDNNKPAYSYKPSALNLFPHIGMLNNKRTYITHNTVQQRDIQESLLLGSHQDME